MESAREHRESEQEAMGVDLDIQQARRMRGDDSSAFKFDEAFEEKHVFRPVPEQKSV